MPDEAVLPVAEGAAPVLARAAPAGLLPPVFAGPDGLLVLEVFMFRCS